MNNKEFIAELAQRCGYTQEKTQSELEEIDPQIIAVISAVVMCMGAGQVLSIKRTDNAGWKRAARLASMSNGIY